MRIIKKQCYISPQQFNAIYDNSTGNDKTYVNKTVTDFTCFINSASAPLCEARFYHKVKHKFAQNLYLFI
jgi:hypothetical protein